MNDLPAAVHLTSKGKRVNFSLQFTWLAIMGGLDLMEEEREKQRWSLLSHTGFCGREATVCECVVFRISWHSSMILKQFRSCCAAFYKTTKLIRTQKTPTQFPPVWRNFTLAFCKKEGTFNMNGISAITFLRSFIRLAQLPLEMLNFNSYNSPVHPPLSMLVDGLRVMRFNIARGHQIQESWVIHQFCFFLSKLG